MARISKLLENIYMFRIFHLIFLNFCGLIRYDKFNEFQARFAKREQFKDNPADRTFRLALLDRQGVAPVAKTRTYLREVAFYLGNPSLPHIRPDLRHETRKPQLQLPTPKEVLSLLHTERYSAPLRLPQR